MSEECRREGELRDQDLESVSGGVKRVEGVRSHYCGMCVAGRGHRELCSGSAEQLTDYLNQHGGLDSWSCCPFLYHS